MSEELELTPEQVAELFPQLENLRLIGLKGPQQIYNATLTAEHAEVVLRVMPTADLSVFGWSNEFIVKAHAISEQSAPGLLRVFDAGHNGIYTYLITQVGPYPRLADLPELPKLDPQNAITLVRDISEGMQNLHNRGIYHGGISSKFIGISPDNQDVLLLPLNIYPAQPADDMEDFGAPEWVTGSAIAFTPAMDVYSLGVLLYILLTGKTPLQANFAMPSTLAKCNTLVDDAVANAIEPDTAHRYNNLGEFVAALNKALSRPQPGQSRLTASPAASAAAAPVTPRPAAVAMTAKREQGGSLAFYFIPALLIALAFTFICIFYKQDVAVMQNEQNAKIIEKNKEQKKKATEQAKPKDNRMQEAFERVLKDPSERTPAPPVEPADDDELTNTPITPATDEDETSGSSAATAMEVPTEAIPSPGLVNWCRKSGTKVQMRSVLNNDADTYGAEKARDSVLSSESADQSVSVTADNSGKPPYYGVDFGADSNRTISKIVIYTPANRSDLPAMKKFRVQLYDNAKEMIELRTFTTKSFGQTSNVCVWDLEPALPVRAIRITTPDEGPVAITELEAYGPVEVDVPTTKKPAKKQSNVIDENDDAAFSDDE